MGREVVVGIYDRRLNGYSFDEFDNWHICGRNDFTNDLYSLFINREVELLILDIYNDGFDGKVVNDCKDLGKDPMDDAKAMFIDPSKFDEIIKEHIQKVKNEREDLHSRIESLQKVRDNTNTLQDWLDIDTFLRELKDDEERLKTSSQELLHRYLDDARRECMGRKENIVSGYDFNRFDVMDPLNKGKVTPRYYPIVLFSD